MTARKSCKYGEYGPFEHSPFLLRFAGLPVVFDFAMTVVLFFLLLCLFYFVTGTEVLILVTGMSICAGH